MFNESELTDLEMTDLIGFIKTIITHITNGSKMEERLVNVMGGVIIETESERLMKQGEAKMLIKLGQKGGLSDAAILDSLQEEMGVSSEKAKAYLEQYGKQLYHV